ncbi:HK97 family phage prohead protease [Allomesorhizobium alhagi]|uniref:Phage head maturation protease n=1 Tax=Mesorhizobium alhagi CCNWXJ12-2 TaxID=1107882 RepID=H0HR47_9HYPH|nr:HK97 family phage prohead protease [Mesorhizobium alhagi]EHK56827.1 Phage head maturation protease [Mesorhizobium alhagi CCNWXJ12-2]
MTKIEKRTALLGVETRAADDGKRTLAGYAAVFNSDADLYGIWIERIEPGAFTPALSADVRALVDHDTGRVIGRTKSGTLRLAEDAKGLHVEIDVPDTTDGNDLWTLVERGDISGMSFGFIVTKQEWDESVEPPIRTIKEVELLEVSAVAFPAYDDTSIGKRSLQEWRDARSNETIKDPAATPVNRAAANLKQRLAMRLDLKVRTGA